MSVCRSARWPQVTRCASVVPFKSFVSQGNDFTAKSQSTATTKPWNTTSLTSRDVRCPSVNQCHSKNYTLLFRFQGSVRYKSDDALSASTRNILEVAAKPGLYHEVKNIIESWVENLNGNLPTEAQNEELKRSIFDLDKRVENEIVTQARTTSEIEYYKTIDGLPEDIILDTSKPSTLKEFAEYILESFTDEKLKELKFMVVRSKSLTNLFFESRIEFEEALKHVENDQIVQVHIGNCFAREESIHKAYNDIQGLLGTTEDLVKKINNLNSTLSSKEENVFEWNEDLVKPTNEKDLGRIVYCSDVSKASALIVSGESGIGKSWFARKYIPNKLGEQDLALIYYSIEDNDGHEMIKSDDSLKNHKMACGNGMRYLHEAKRNHGDEHDLGDVYGCLSDLSMEYNRKRDTAAYDWLTTTIGNRFEKDVVVKEWWVSEYSAKTIKKLVLVVDEVGRNPELARGLVSIVRELYVRIIKTGKAKQVLLVLVGSGLDRHIRYDRITGFEVEKNQAKIASLGTDPMLSEVIILQGPDLSPNKILYGIPTNSILKGTYSRTLSTNTRMLTRGVLPMMKIPQFTEHMDPTKKPARYEALGSTNIVMDYAARNYIALNGLARRKFESHELRRILLKQFKLLLHDSLVSIKDKNPAAKQIMNDLEIKMPRDLEEVSSLGLVTADVKGTSAALRYLACNGSTAPIYAQDGIGFEIMVQYHLVRLMEACNSDLQDSSQGCANHWVGQYNLSQAWPPRSTLGDDKLLDPEVIRNDLQQKYANTFHEKDIDTIRDILEDKDDFDLVMRQTVSNAQGPDLMILSKRDERVLLHLIQCKNWKQIPKVKSERFVKSFWALGVKIGPEEDIGCTPDNGSAGYSYLAIQHFAEKLGEKLRSKVMIGNRILVFSQRWNHDSDLLRLPIDKGVMVWTQEMLEPTISALYNEENESEKE